MAAGLCTAVAVVVVAVLWVTRAADDAIADVTWGDVTLVVAVARV